MVSWSKIKEKIWLFLVLYVKENNKFCNGNMLTKYSLCFWLSKHIIIMTMSSVWRRVCFIWLYLKPIHLSHYKSHITHLLFSWENGHPSIACKIFLKNNHPIFLKSFLLNHLKVVSRKLGYRFKVNHYDILVD